MRPELCLLAVLIATPACAQILCVARLPPSRDFGLLVGDTFVGAATVTVGPGTILDATSLPAMGPVGPSVDIRGSDVAFASVPEGRRYTIRITYQNFSAPDHVSSVGVPAFTLGFLQSGKRVTASVPGFSFTASPIRTELETKIDASVLRPDRPALLMATAAPERLIAAGCAIAALAACALAASLGALNWLPRRAGPFAAALRAMKRQRGTVTERAAFLLLHRAFDETAGARVFADDLETFFARQPRFATLRTDVEAFFASSRSVFFGACEGPAPASPVRLARDLMRAERRR